MTLLHSGIRMKNVMVADGLRVHICPKVATAAISSAMHGTKYRHAFPEEDGPEYRWGVVRHPLDRLVSCWAFFCNAPTEHEIRGQHDILELGYRWQMPFDEFLDIALVEHEKNAHTRRQVRFAGPHTFDRLCRLESLGEEWAALRERFPEIKKDIQVIHKSDHRPWKSYYTDQQRKRAEAVFAEDLDLYGRTS